MTSYFATVLSRHMQQWQILVYAEVGLFKSFLKLIMLIIGTKDLLFCIHFIIFYVFMFVVG
jgi:hypothetical protein